MGVYYISRTFRWHFNLKLSSDFRYVYRIINIISNCMLIFVPGDFKRPLSRDSTNNLHKGFW